jgi:hypothetical protein
LTVPETFWVNAQYGMEECKTTRKGLTVPQIMASKRGTGITIQLFVTLFPSSLPLPAINLTHI